MILGKLSASCRALESIYFFLHVPFKSEALRQYLGWSCPIESCVQIYLRGLVWYDFFSLYNAFRHSRKVTSLLLLQWQTFRRSSFFSATSWDHYRLDTPSYVYSIESPSFSKFFFLNRKAFHPESFFPSETDSRRKLPGTLQF